MSLPSAKPPSAVELSHLRPCTGLEMLDRVFAVLRARSGILIGLGAAGGILSLMAERLAVPLTPQSAMLGMAVELVAWWPAAAVLMAAFQTLLLPRRPLEAGAALRGALARFPHLVLTLFLVEIVIGVVGFQLPAMLMREPNEMLSLSPLSAGLAGAVVATALYLAALWALAPAVVLLEGRMLFDALGRSSELMRLRFSPRLFGDSAMRRLLLLLTLAAGGAMAANLTIPTMRWFAAGMPRLSLAGSSLPTVPFHTGWEAANLAVSVVFFSLLSPYLQTALATLYAECRIRREGIDIQTRLLAREAEEQRKEI